MNKYFTIDCSKMVMAIMIVALHSMPLFHNETVDQYATWSFDLMVPLFFCFSGFFFAKNTDLRKSLKHLLPLYLFYAAFSWPLSFIVFEGLTWLQALHKGLFLGTFNVGWFIIALIWSMTIIYFFDKLKNKILRYSAITAFALLCYSVCLSILSYHSYLYHGVIKAIQNISFDLFVVPQWSFMRGILFFTIGFLFNRLEINLPRAISIPLLIIALISYFSELTLSNQAGILVTSINFSMPFVVFSGMAVILSYCRPIDDHGFGKKFRQTSTMLYLCHPMIMFLLYRAFGITDGWFRFIPTLIVFAVGLAIYQRLRRKPHFQWLRYAC